MKINKKTFGLRASFGWIDLTLMVVAMVAWTLNQALSHLVKPQPVYLVAVFWPQCSYTYVYLCMYLFAFSGVLQEALNRGLFYLYLICIYVFI